MKRPHRGRRFTARLVVHLALAGASFAGASFAGDTARVPAAETALPSVDGGCVWANFPGAYQPITCVPSP